ncbi:MAG: 50S ribosomal protein L10 [Planctomycetota bacterium]|nr:50S ribosomal protein L10 [Planctomycetota bacterium]
MSKNVKELMMRDYSDWLEGQTDALVISIRGIEANDNNRLRQELMEKDIRIRVVRNNLARKAFSDSPLANLAPVLKGPTALAFGGETVVDVARELVKWARDIEKLELKGAILDGELFEGPAGVERLSKLPTRDEAIAQVVTLVLSPARKLVGQVKGPGGRIAGIVKTVQDKLEKGETIAPVA